jgi:hypothetical protein
VVTVASSSFSKTLGFCLEFEHEDEKENENDHEDERCAFHFYNRPYPVRLSTFCSSGIANFPLYRSFNHT